MAGVGLYLLAAAAQRLRALRRLRPVRGLQPLRRSGVRLLMRRLTHPQTPAESPRTRGARSARNRARSQQEKRATAEAKGPRDVGPVAYDQARAFIASLPKGEQDAAWSDLVATLDAWRGTYAMRRPERARPHTAA